MGVGLPQVCLDLKASECVAPCGKASFGARVGVLYSMGWAAPGTSNMQSYNSPQIPSDPCDSGYGRDIRFFTCVTSPV